MDVRSRRSSQRQRPRRRRHVDRGVRRLCERSSSHRPARSKRRVFPRQRGPSGRHWRRSCAAADRGVRELAAGRAVSRGGQTIATSSSDTVATAGQDWIYLGRAGVTRWTRVPSRRHPPGNRVAYVRGGWIRLIRLTNGGGDRRLVKGSQPTFSPDGRELAFIGRDGHVFVLTLRTMHTHQIGRAVARSLDLGAAASHVNGRDLGREAARECSPYFLSRRWSSARWSGRYAARRSSRSVAIGISAVPTSFRSST